MEVEDEIAAPDFATKFPELHHYTDLNGLTGIVSTNTLWATHFAHLNDRAEMQALRQPMIKILQPTVVSRVRDMMVNRRARRALRGANIEREVSFFVQAVFQTAFERGATEPIAESYITSFCTHIPGSYESKNGLLSQWRAYGGENGRFCLVFDTAKMVSLLSLEWNVYHYLYGKIITVVYHQPNVSIGSIFPDLISFYTEHLADGITHGMKGPSGEMIVEFIKAATRFKHQGFSEEQEARIIMLPMPDRISAISRAEKLPGSEKQDKSVRSKTKGSTSLPYIVLFEHENARLPITRVIVGPGRNEDANFDAARAVVGRQVQLTRSETPFIG